MTLYWLVKAMNANQTAMQAAEVITVISSSLPEELLPHVNVITGTLETSLAPYEAVPRAANIAKYVCMEFV